MPHHQSFYRFTIIHMVMPNFHFRYNVDCAAAEGLYGLAEGAFGNDAGAEGGSEGGSGGGQCPNANPLSDAECAGTVSNCWSPGQPDTDCPNYGLCCFDGCVNTCVDGPQGKLLDLSFAMIYGQWPKQKKNLVKRSGSSYD